MTSLTATSNHIPLFFITLASHAIKLQGAEMPFYIGLIRAKKAHSPKPTPCILLEIRKHVAILKSNRLQLLS
jgi:hypothetical protein